MNENHREPSPTEPQELADHLVAAMESTSETNQDESQMLGDAILQTASVDLPEPNSDLRELVCATLDDTQPIVSPTKPVKSKASKSRAWRMWWTVAAALLVFGSIAYMAFPPQFRVAFQGEAEDALVRVHDTSSSMSAAKAASPEPVNRLKAERVARHQQLGRLFSESINSAAPSANPENTSGQTAPLPSAYYMEDDIRFAPQSNLDIAFGAVGGVEVDSFASKTPKFSLPSITHNGQSQDAYGYTYQRLSRGEDLGESRSKYGGGENGEILDLRFEIDKSEMSALMRGYLGGGQPNDEQYEAISENQFNGTRGANALSTFSIDVDTASYSNMRRFLTQGQRVPPNAVRIEELVNYFDYDYPQPEGEDPFSVNMEMATCPWNDRHQLLRIGLKGKEIHRDERPAANIVFLIDVSGSMNSHDKLPLLKSGFQLMVNALHENDRVSIVTYAGESKVVLQPTSGDQKRVINEAIENLKSGGSTNGSAGIETAYQLAQQNFIQEGTNKVILASDGDLNVGITSDQDLVKLISNKASEGVFLSVLGFGTGNLKDSKMEKLADNGNGNYAYIDGVREAHKVLVQGMSGSLVTIAKDVKLQLEFNPAEVKAYRLIGYENRVMAAQDFANDAKDAGEIGAGHSVTALYELVPNDPSAAATAIPRGMKYQVPTEAPATRIELSDQANSGEVLTLAMRYKQPNANESKLIEFTLPSESKSFSTASGEFKFAASVAAFGMILRGSEHRGNATPQWIQQVASESIGNDKSGYRAEFIDLVRRFSSVR